MEDNVLIIIIDNSDDDDDNDDDRPAGKGNSCETRRLIIKKEY